MNSQNRMNAGAEYVLYRIWGALQGRNGIHVESLLACLGALAGYSCQMCARQTALNVSLTESPLSVWSLVGRAVQKLGQPLPDIDDIFRHVTQTAGTSAFGIPRVPPEHRPRHPATFYLTQIWPQILPIAQRFCGKPAQMPVLFGIALQRAIELTRDVMNPTLSATIAMECAVAMSKVPPLEAPPDPIVQPAALAMEAIFASAPMASPERSMRASPARTRRTIPVPRRRNAVGAVIAIASLAFITVAGATWKTDRTETPQAARKQNEQRSPEVQSDTRALEEPTPEAQINDAAQPPQEVVPAEVSPEQPADATNENRPLDPSNDGTAEIVPPPEMMN